MFRADHDIVRWVASCLPTRPVKLFVVLLLSFPLAACHHEVQQPSGAPVTLSYLRLGWSQPDELPSAESLSQQFIRQTNIQLKPIPVPESTLDQLELSRRLLEGGSGPDVLGIDVIWPAILQQNLLDLRPYIGAELPSLQPELVASYDVDGRIVAVAHDVHMGILEYRADLLHEYGFAHPPKTWVELETMAAKIQAGERAKGHQDFWGYVWQGAPAEGLTCNALEWQIAEGGGRIIEEDRTISVNNRAAIRSWQRAKHWIGWISPPSVLAYHERDSIDAFDAGSAAFNRVWGGTPDGAAIERDYSSPDVNPRKSRPSKTGYAQIPGGPGGRASTLGGSGLGVSSHSAHPAEAVRLVRFLIDAQIRSSQQQHIQGPADSAPPELYDLPSIYYPPKPSQKPGQGNSDLVARPSTVTGSLYDQVARAYFTTVHAVLAGEKPAPKAAAELEKQLEQITHFRSGAPKASK